MTDDKKVIPFDLKQSALDELIREFSEKMCPIKPINPFDARLSVRIPSEEELLEFFLKYEEIKSRTYGKKHHK